MTTPSGPRDQQLITELRALAPAPPPGALLAPERDRIETALVAAVRTAAAAGVSSRRRSLAPVGLVAACVLAVGSLAVLWFLPSSPDGSATALPVRAEPAAAAALDGLATAALSVSAPAVRDDQFVYVRSTVVTNEGDLGGAVGLGAPHERELWLSQATGGDARGLIREFGQDWPLYSGRAVAVGPDRPTYEWIAGLPTDPDRIVSELKSTQPLGSDQTPDQYAFERIGDLITEGLVPPALASALFEAVTKLPGVELVDRAQDAIGRTGFGISRTDEVFGITTVWVFRPGDPAPLGVRWYFDGRDRTLFGATAVLERGVADELGTAPEPDRARTATPL